MLCKQGVERIVRVRQSATNHLRTLLSNIPLCGLLPNVPALRKVLPRAELDDSLLAPLEAVCSLSAVLALKPYQVSAAAPCAGSRRARSDIISFTYFACPHFSFCAVLLTHTDNLLCDDPRGIQLSFSPPPTGTFEAQRSRLLVKLVSKT